MIVRPQFSGSQYTFRTAGAETAEKIQPKKLKKQNKLKKNLGQSRGILALLGLVFALPISFSFLHSPFLHSYFSFFDFGFFYFVEFSFSHSVTQSLSSRVIACNRFTVS